MVALLACGGESVVTPPPPPPPPPTPVVTSVAVAPGTASLAPLDTIRLSATVRDQNGQPMTGRTVTWTSATSAVATVSAEGLVTAVTTGTATVTATVEGKTGSSAITVLAGVARVELSHADLVLDVGRTQQLTATLKDAQGNPLSGRTIGWRSTVPAVATVSPTGLVTAVAGGGTRIIATVEGKADTATVAVPLAPAVITLGSAAVSRTVGVGGDTLRVTGGDGTSYTLAIPPLALRAPVTITMTPIGTATGIPLSGGFAAGVDLKPSGLAFVRPATLTITTTKTAPAGQQVIGVSYAGNGDSLAPVAAAADNGTITLSVPHFSGAGAGFGTTQDIERLYFASRPAPRSNAFYAGELLMASAANPRDPLFEVQVLRDWWDDVVQPTIANATTDAQIVNALAVWADWDITANLVGTFRRIAGGRSAILGGREAQWNTTLAAKIKEAILANLQGCRNTNALLADRVTGLDNALFWHRIASVGFGVGTTQFGLDLAWLRANLCATVVADSVSLPEPLENRANTLEIRYKLQLAPDGRKIGADFEVTVDVQGATHGLPQATAATPPGYYTGTITPSGAGEAVTVFLTACYFQGLAGTALGAAPELCGDYLAGRTSQSLFRVDYQGLMSLGSTSCNRRFEESVVRFVNVSEQSACGASGWNRTGTYQLAATIPKGMLKAELSKSGAAQTFQPVVFVSADVLDRVTIDAPGLTGAIGRFQGQLEVRATIGVSSGGCNSLVAQGTVDVEVVAARGSPNPPQTLVPNTRVGLRTCNNTLTNPWSGFTTLTSGDIVFRYGEPLNLAFRYRLEASTTQISPPRAGDMQASVMFEYRWLGMLGLPPGATVRSATGFDWSKAATP